MPEPQSRDTDRARSPFACNDIPPDLLQLASAVAAIPNNDEAWDDWTTLGLAIYAACGIRGYPIFNAWSARSRKYDPVTTWQRWLEIDGSPPDRFGSRGRTILPARWRSWLASVSYADLSASHIQ